MGILTRLVEDWINESVGASQSYSWGVKPSCASHTSNYPGPNTYARAPKQKIIKIIAKGKKAAIKHISSVMQIYSD